MAMDTLARLEQTIARRRDADPSDSYVAKLHHQGIAQIARKLGEEGVEAAIAAVSADRDEVIGNQTRVKVVKNKLAPPLSECQLVLDPR